MEEYLTIYSTVTASSRLTILTFLRLIHISLSYWQKSLINERDKPVLNKTIQSYLLKLFDTCWFSVYFHDNTLVFNI